MPVLALAPVAATAFWGAVGAGAAGTAAVVAAHETSGAAQNAAALTSGAANHAADEQSASNAEALAFQKDQASQAAATAETNRHADYDQWASQQQRMGSLGQMLGLAPRSIPGYVPLPSSVTAPTSTSTAPGAPAAASGAAASGNPQDPAFITQQLQGVYKALGVAPTGPGTGPTDIAYMASKVAQTGGWTPDNANYWPTRIAQELQKGSGGAAAAPATSATPAASSASTAGSIGSFLAPPPTTGLALPSPYRPGSIGSYVNG